MMSVAGCIDSNGSISGRATKGIDGHRASESRGKRWRWIIHRQEFHILPPKTLAELNNPRANELTDEEHFAVCDWLIRHGYADESILSNNALSESHEN
jgi:hypothetical protein